MKTENLAKEYALNLFERTYWSSGGRSTKMKNNRIRFAKEYDLAEMIRPTYIDSEAISRKLMDHVEVYKVRHSEEYLVLVSPYKKDGVEEEATQLGFIDIYPVYSTKTISFIKTFDSFEELNIFLNPFQKYLD